MLKVLRLAAMTLLAVFALVAAKSFPRLTPLVYFWPALVVASVLLVLLFLRMLCGLSEIEFGAVVPRRLSCHPGFFLLGIAPSALLFLCYLALAERIRVDFAAGAAVFLPVLFQALWSGTTEELVFRGYLKQLHAQNNIGAFVANVVISLVFSAMHITNLGNGIPAQAALLYLFNMFLVSLGWCLVRDVSGSVYVCIFAHAGNNILMSGRIMSLYGAEEGTSLLNLSLPDGVQLADGFTSVPTLVIWGGAIVVLSILNHRKSAKRLEV